MRMEKKIRSCKLPRYSDGLLRQALRYGVAAALGFAADYGTLILLKEGLGLHYLLAAAIAFAIGIAVNYLVGVLFVFRRGELPRALELTGFLLISLAALGLTELLLYALTELFGLHYLLSRLLAGAATYLFNFLMRRYALYRTPRKPGTEKATAEQTPPPR